MKHFQYKNSSIRYTDTGKGTCVVFLHGFLENLHLWDEIIQDFSHKHRIITLDLLGHGKSDCIGYIHTMEDQADMLHALLSHLKIRKVILVGHSMGGYVSLAFAELYADNVKGLVLVNSTSRADSDERKENRNRAIEMVKKNKNLFIRMAIQNLFDTEILDTISDKVEQFTQQALETPTQGVIAASEGMKERNDREVLLHFSPYPKCIIVGKKDPILSAKAVEEETFENETQFISLPCGHVAPIECPELLKENLKSIIKQW
ncbi:alpha/beta fold hydrolase [Capnocytophaga sp. ARDL2]|uniref:alpha/beta fold hydrolase n=1 Tax=Capnocytophaga sp. ARDL2 TaxID=3238809 RepID=UPI003556A1B4